MSLLFHDPEDGPARPDPFMILLWELGRDAVRTWRVWWPWAALSAIVLLMAWLEGRWA